MNKIYYYSKRLRVIPFSLIVITLLFLQSCNSKKVNAIEVVTGTMDFKTVNEIPSGWNTFRYENKSTETHFFLLDKMPDGKTIKDDRDEVIPVFQKGMDLINAGKPDEAQAEFGKLPEWIPGVVYSGGCGLVSPGQSCDVTLKLDPGYYVMECYVKNPAGVFHAAMGMTKELVVTDKDAGNSPPSADVEISISSTGGIDNPETIKKGKTTFSVYFKDQTVHENFVGHDVNLVKLKENYNPEELEKWMNWTDPKGLITPAPQNVIFLGGVNDSPAGSTGYFTADLEPGNYALISEVPDASEKGMLKTFAVAE